MELAIIELIDRISDYNTYKDTDIIPISIFSIYPKYSILWIVPFILH